MQPSRKISSYTGNKFQELLLKALDDETPEESSSVKNAHVGSISGGRGKGPHPAADRLVR